MVAVVILVVALIVVVVCGLAAWAVHRRGSDDVHSVDGYRSTLHTLEEIEYQTAFDGERARGCPRDPGSDRGGGSTAGVACLSTWFDCSHSTRARIR